MIEEQTSSQENEITNNKKCKTDEGDPIERLPPKEKDKIGIIYGLVDPRYGIIRYGGQTTQFLNRRFTKHLSEMGKRSYKVNWIKKLLSLNMKPIPVILKNNIPVPFLGWLQIGNKFFECYDVDETDKNEKKYIVFIRKHCFKHGIKCVNIDDGGSNSGRWRKEYAGYPLTEEHKRKISVNAKRINNTPEYKEADRQRNLNDKNPWYGKHPSKETLERLSVASKKMWDRPEYRNKLSGANKIAWNKGQKMPEERRQKMIGRIPWSKGKKMSEESCRKNSLWHIDKHPSEETKEKLRKTSQMWKTKQMIIEWT